MNIYEYVSEEDSDWDRKDGWLEADPRRAVSLINCAVCANN